MTLVIIDNSSTVLVLQGIVGEQSIRDVIGSDEIHILIRKCFIRMYLEAYILPEFRKTQPYIRRLSHEEVLEKVRIRQFDSVINQEPVEDIYKFLYFINENFLVKFQFCLLHLPSYGLRHEMKEEFRLRVVSLIERITSTGEFAFDYSRNEVEKKKSL